MQVITGKYRGRHLKSPDSARPTLQRVKISLFSMLGEYITSEQRVLDLFAGSGALGIEMLSREAGFVVFVDQDKKATKCILDNLRNIDKKQYKIINADHLSAMKMLRGEKPFDVVFLDPPYASNAAVSCVEILDRYDLIADNGVVVIETETGGAVPTIKGFELKKDRSYGTARIFIFEKLENE